MASYLYQKLVEGFPDRDRPAFLAQNDEATTYGELEAAAARYAHALRALKVRPGDRVAMQVEKSLDAVMVYLACLRAGAVLLPLNTAYTPPEIEYFLNDSAPRLFICDPAKLAFLETIARAAGVESVETMDRTGAGGLRDRAMSAPAAFDDVARGPDDLAGILYTSGTTGRSKGAMISHNNLASNAATLRDIWRFTRDDVLLHALPIYHTHGLFVAINVLLMAGGTTIFLPKFDPAEMLRLMPRATSMMGVPTFYTRLLDEDGLNQEAVKNMRLFISGSAPLLAETHRAWRARTGQAILERYGMTETNMIASNPYDGARVAGTVGFPLPGVAARIVDPDSGAPLPQGEIGMIEVSGPNVFSGYWNMPEKTAQDFREDGFFITGDLGMIDADGYFHIVGRGKDLVISGGFNVYPKEIESHIDALPGVIESAVIGVPHKRFGEGVTAIIARAKGADINEAEILASLEGRLAKFKQPKKIVFVAEMPRNSMGKIQKNILRETYKDLYR